VGFSLSCSYSTYLQPVNPSSRYCSACPAKASVQPRGAWAPQPHRVAPWGPTPHQTLSNAQHNHICTCNCKTTLALRYKHPSHKQTRSQQSYDCRISTGPGAAPLATPRAAGPPLAQIREVRACSPAGEVDVVRPRSVQTQTCCSAPEARCLSASDSHVTICLASTH
jgi:hypothetical protein